MRILLPAEAAEPVRFAAEELASYLTRITDGEVALVEEGATDFLLATADAAPSVASVAAKLSGRGAEAFALETVGDRLALVGNSPRAVVYAVYHFLETHLGCRWYTPDPEEEVIPRRSRDDVRALIARGIAEVEEPDFSIRMRRYLVYDLGKAGTPLADTVMADLPRIVAWMAKLRMNILQYALDHSWDPYTNWPGFRAVIPELRKRGLEAGAGGHCMHMFMGATEFREHPDWRPFYDGARRDHGQFCTNNPEAVEHYIGGLVRFLKENPEVTYFAPWPNDTGGWCACPDCAGTPSHDRYMQLGNLIFERLKRDAPQVRFTHFAYGSHADPPTQVSPLPGMTMTLCTWGRDLAVPFEDPRTGERFQGLLGNWRAICERTGGSLVLHEKYCRHLGLGLRLMPLPVMAEDLRFLREQGLAGLELPSAYMGWWPKSLNWYAIARLMWDADTDVDGLVRDFFEQFYGPAAGETRVIYELVTASHDDCRYWAANIVQQAWGLKPGMCPTGAMVRQAQKTARGLGEAAQLARELRGRFTDDAPLARRLGHLVTAVDYAAREFGAFAELAAGARALARADLAPDAQAYRARVDEAVEHFRAAEPHDRARREYAGRPEDFGLLWNLTAAGPFGLYRSTELQDWVRLAEERRGQAQGRPRPAWQIGVEDGTCDDLGEEGNEQETQRRLPAEVVCAVPEDWAERERWAMLPKSHWPAGLQHAAVIHVDFEAPAGQYVLEIGQIATGQPETVRVLLDRETAGSYETTVGKNTVHRVPVTLGEGGHHRLTFDQYEAGGGYRFDFVRLVAAT